MTLVAIIIYNRFENLQRWLYCWKQCDQTDAELIVIHNYDREPDKRIYKNLCDKNGIKYFPRLNRGYDIGAFKDFCRGNIDGIPTYDNILWITDDTIPMSKDFVSQFTSKLNEKIGCTCMEISKRNSPLHVRTSGFCLPKKIAQSIQFAEIKTKEDCYRFEHRSRDSMMLQITRMGYDSLMLADLKDSPLWDTHNRPELNRMMEHNRVFYGDRKVIFICPIYNDYPAIISSMICQTFGNWELRLIHDGPNKTGIKEIVNSYNDKRVIYSETPKHLGTWGHYIRSEEIQKLNENSFVVVTNADNYHVPVYVEKMLSGFISDNVIATYCAEMTHSYRGWDSQPCRMMRGHVDCAGVMMRSKIAKKIGWNDISTHSADWQFFKDIITEYGANGFARVKGNLLVHN